MADARSRSALAVAVAAFALSAAAVLAFALRGGGGYDLVPRHEAAILVWAVIGLGYALGLLPRGGWPLSGRVATGFAAAFAIWCALALTWTSSSERTGVELARIAFVAGLVVLALSLVDRRTLPAVAGGVLAGAAGVVVLALASRLFPSHFPSAYRDVLGDTRRLNYPFGYWNSVGALALMTATGALAASAGAPSPAVRAATIAVVPACVAVGYLTYSRGVIADTAVAVVVVIAASRARWVALGHAAACAVAGVVVVAVLRHEPAVANATGTGGRGTLILAVLASAALLAALAVATGALSLDERVRLAPRPARVSFAVGAVLVLAALAIFGPHAYDRAHDSFVKPQEIRSKTDPSARLRSLSGQRNVLWAAGMRAFRHEPLHGIGPGTYEFWWNQDKAYNGFVRDTHNQYVQLLAEYGIVGLLLFVALLVALLAGLIDRARGPDRTDRAIVAGALGVLAVWIVFAAHDWLWQSPADTALAFFAAAAVIAGGASARTMRTRLPVRIGVPLLALVAIAVELPALAATSQVRGSQEAVRGGNFDLALARANDAVAAEPWAASPYLQRALVSEATGDFASAAADAQRAADRESQDWRPLLILARIEAERRDVPAALRAYRRAERLKPALRRSGQ